MSTRATYRIKEINSFGNVSQYFYIHYDGYPEGAAVYFTQLLANFDALKEASLIGQHCLSWRRGKAIIAFGMLAYTEFTSDARDHGDTEFHYDLAYSHREKAWFVEALAINRHCETPTTEVLFDGPIADFIAKYTKKETQHKITNI